MDNFGMYPNNYDQAVASHDYGVRRLNMTDKKLLELAAKAYGFGDKFGLMWTETEYPKNSGRYGAFWNGYGHGDTAQPIVTGKQIGRASCRERV